MEETNQVEETEEEADDDSTNQSIWNTCLYLYIFSEICLRNLCTEYCLIMCCVTNTYVSYNAHITCVLGIRTQ